MNLPHSLTGFFRVLVTAFSIPHPSRRGHGVCRRLSRNLVGHFCAVCEQNQGVGLFACQPGMCTDLASCYLIRRVAGWGPVGQC